LIDSKIDLFSVIPLGLLPAFNVLVWVLMSALPYAFNKQCTDLVADVRSSLRHAVPHQHRYAWFDMVTCMNCGGPNYNLTTCNGIEGTVLGFDHDFTLEESDWDSRRCVTSSMR
jgi:hypothetical protein